MKFAIIAAGEGSRLASEGVAVPKPLVKVGDECLIDRLIRVFLENAATEIVVVCHAGMPQVAAHLDTLRREGLQGREVPLRYVVRQTPSSMHSFFEISPMLMGGPFVLTTVDTVFREDEFRAYVSAFRHSKSDGLMGVTDYVADERPLYVRVSDGQVIGGFYDSKADAPDLRFVSAGIYGLRPQALATLQHCVERGEMRMRNFQRALIADGQQLLAWPFSRVIDVDHVDDIREAETLNGEDFEHSTD
jgi:NDP-sugar pyrophosphorylase family protein